MNRSYQRTLAKRSSECGPRLPSVLLGGAMPAQFTLMLMPPNLATVASMHFCMSASIDTSPTSAKALLLLEEMMRIDER